MELPASSVSLSHVHLVPFGGRPSHRLAFKQSIESIRRCTTLTVPMPHTTGHFTNRLRNGSRRLGCKPGCRERPVAAEKEAPLPPVRCLATHTSKTRPLGKCWAAALLAIGLAGPACISRLLLRKSLRPRGNRHSSRRAAWVASLPLGRLPPSMTPRSGPSPQVDLWIT